MGVAWPVASDFTTRWLGSTASTETLTLAAELVAEATDYALERIKPAAAAAYGIDINDGLGCPRPLFRAIVLDAARIASRRGSSAGIEGFGDFAVSVPSADADYARLTRNYFHWPEL